MIFQSPGDVAFYINTFPVYYYGIIMAVAVSAGVMGAYYLCKHLYKNINPEIIIDISPMVIIAGIIGARLYYCMLNITYYWTHPLQILNFREGGLSIHGALLFGGLMLFYQAKKYRIQLPKLLDIFAVSAALAQSIGRWGNFFNSEAYGFPTELPWKLFIAPSKRPEAFMNFDYFHPTFLYESILNFIMFVVLFFIIKKYGQKAPGVTACYYLVIYSLIRMFVEHFRIDSALNVAGIPIAVIVSILLFMAGLWGLSELQKDA